MYQPKNTKFKSSATKKYVKVMSPCKETKTQTLTQ